MTAMWQANMGKETKGATSWSIRGWSRSTPIFIVLTDWQLGQNVPLIRSKRHGPTWELEENCRFEDAISMGAKRAERGRHRTMRIEIEPGQQAMARDSRGRDVVAWSGARRRMNLNGFGPGMIYANSS